MSTEMLVAARAAASRTFPKNSIAPRTAGEFLTSSAFRRSGMGRHLEFMLVRFFHDNPHLIHGKSWMLPVSVNLRCHTIGRGVYGAAKEAGITTQSRLRSPQ